jgi:hypothetical protein
VFQVGSAHGRRALRFQGYLVTSLVLEGIHFLVYNVCSFSHTATEKSSILEGWGINALIAIELTDIDHFLLYVAPVGLLLG